MGKPRRPAPPPVPPMADAEAAAGGHRAATLHELRRAATSERELARVHRTAREQHEGELRDVNSELARVRHPRPSRLHLTFCACVLTTGLVVPV
eukprot:SAG25_NODE_664_length_6070_cov_60.968849_2_plen_94_part_00